MFQPLPQMQSAGSPRRAGGRSLGGRVDPARSSVMSKRKAPDKDEEDDVDDPNEDEEEKRRREDREDDEMQERLTKRSSKDRMGCAPTAVPALCYPPDIALRVHPRAAQ